jgi:hypothetical protein
MQLETFEERYRYLQIRGEVGCATFGHNRWINQNFYTSSEWRRLRRDIIVRDASCDLAVPGREIHSDLIVHHMNPITQRDLEHGTPAALDPENLICTTLRTHNAIHFGDESLLLTEFVPRSPGDTKLW